MLPRSVIVVILLFGCLLLTGCSDTPTPTPVPTSTPAATSTALPEAISTPLTEPTATLEAVETSSNGTIVVGSRDFTEQLVLGQILIALLEEVGYEVVDKTGLGGTNTAHNALKNGEVDLIWEYIGTILSESHAVPTTGLPTEVEVALDMVSALDARHHNLVWMAPSAFNDTYTLMIKPGTIADQIVSIEDLATFMNQKDVPLKLCVENEFYSRGDGLFPLQKHYGFAFKEEQIEIVSYDHLYEGLRSGLCDVAEGFSTDGRISAWGFQNLIDSKKFFPVYNASPVIRQEVLEQHPELAELLNQIGPYLDDETMTQLNERVDLGYDGDRNSGDEESPAAVANDFLTKAGLIGERPQIVVGSRDFTEQLVLGQILIGLLEDTGFEVVDQTGLGGTNMAHDALKNGEVDVIWEYIGTVLSGSHQVPATGLPTDLKTGFEMVSALDKRHHNLVWMTPSAFNDTYTLMIKPGTLPEELSTIEELAAYMNQNQAPLTLCVENEFYSRGDGLLPLQKHYGFAFKEENIELVGYDHLYEGLREGICDVAEGFSTDGRISAWGFQNLVDSKQFFPTYHASPIIRQEVLDNHPELRNLLGNVATYLDNETITLLNARVDVGADGARNSGDEATPKEVARDFLEKTGLIGDRPQLVVGSRDFTEQLLLGQISIVLLEEAGYTVVDKTALGGTNSGYDALNQGEIDLIWEYTGTALSEFHKIRAEELPTEPAEAWQQIAALDDPLGLVWLTPGTFNNTYTLMIKDGSLPKEIESIEELAAYMNKNDAPLRLCVENEFYTRGDGLLPLQEHYDFAFKEENIEIVAYDQLYEGLRDGICDVAEGFSTDARISAWGFQTLIDSKQFFPAYNAAPIVRKEALITQPQIAELFEQVGPHLDNQTITRLNQRIDIGADGERNSGDEESIRSVAELFLCEIGLIESDCPQSSLASVAQTEETTAASDQEDDQEGEPATDQQDNPATSDQEDTPATSDQEGESATDQQDNPATSDQEGDQEGEPATSDQEDDQEDEPATSDQEGDQEGEPATSDQEGDQEGEPASDQEGEPASGQEGESASSDQEGEPASDQEGEPATSDQEGDQEGEPASDQEGESASGQEGESASSDQEGESATEPATSDQEGEAATDQQEKPASDEKAESTSEQEFVLICENIILNGGFESNRNWTLSAGSIESVYSREQTHQEKFAVRLGTTEPDRNGHSSVNQFVSLPENATSATLTFWYYPISQDLVGGDIQGALIYDGTFTFTRQRLLSGISNEQKWIRQATDLSIFIGEEINLHFFVINDGDVVPSAMYLDDVSLEVCYDLEQE